MPIALVEGWKPGALGFIIGEHGRYYARHWEFGAFFEAKVAAGIGSFLARYEPAQDRLFLACENEDILGALVLDCHDPESATGEVHLRWFILSEAARGRGIGQTLMTAAIAHLDRLNRPCWLATFAGLDAARHLYEKNGFVLVSEIDATSWGRTMREQVFRRPAIAHPELR